MATASLQHQMMIPTINCDAIVRKLFLLALFLYPLPFLMHTIYLIPQFIISLLLFGKWIYKQQQLPYHRLKFLCCLLFPLLFLVPLWLELTSLTPKPLLSLKIFINGSTIILIYLARVRLIDKNALTYLKIITAAYGCMAILCLLFFSSSEGIIISLLEFTKHTDSSKLYSLAEPLDIAFLGKNITAMFIATLFAYFLFLSSIYHKKVSVLSYLLFGVTILLFLSRQGVFAFLILTAFHIFLHSSPLSRWIYSVATVIVLIAFFYLLFDFTNEKDGSQERLQLYKHFIENFYNFFWFGLGVEELENTIRQGGIPIDNYHFFAMNQIGTYGCFHMLLFNLFLAILFLMIPRKYKVASLQLIAGYFLNVCFQTFGFEFQNLWLFMLIASSLPSEAPAEHALGAALKSA